MATIEKAGMEAQALEETANQVFGAIALHGPMTIVDLWDQGFQRGKPLHEALRGLEANGLISNVLKGGYSRHRIYSAKKNEST